MSVGNGSHSDYNGEATPDNTGTFPVAVALEIKNLPRFLHNINQAVDDDQDGTLLMYFNRNDIQLSDKNGVIRITLTLD